MKIRTPDELQSRLDDNLAWRRKELAVLRGAVREAKNAKKQALLRAAISVLYAHWEGFLKSCSEQYLEFVAQLGLRFDEVGPNLRALAAKRRVTDFLHARQPGVLIDFISWIEAAGSTKLSLPTSDFVRRFGNITVDVFRNIISVVGVHYRPEYQIAEKPIIDRLVSLRNDLAHGDWQDVDETEFEQLYEHIEKFMVLVSNDLANSARTKGYLKKK